MIQTLRNKQNRYGVPRPAYGLFLFLFLLGVCYYLPSLAEKTGGKEALFYKKLGTGIVQCGLCPRGCTIPSGRRGFCGVRENRDGTLYSVVYGKAVAVHIDPIEKKPFFHYLPQKSAFSIATAGCNLKCKFCQNWEISQRLPEEVDYTFITPDELVSKARESGSPVIAYTYSEPTVFYEYMLETAKLAREQGLKNVLHSNGYINEEPLRLLAPYLDAANIDLKAFDDDHYAQLTEGTLQPVLRSLKILKEAGVHLEITNLVLSGYNDSEKNIRRMCLWINENLGSDVPVHFSRFFPTYKFAALNPTPVAALEKIRQAAMDCGLKYVYIGNVPGHAGENTYCPKCKNIVVKRTVYIVTEVNLLQGKCRFCGEKIEGVWE
jgi:pyruvate formate lyase activating enzyme